MRFVGFGCSWMYGSELEHSVDPSLSWHEKIKYQHQNCFLGLLGDNENLSDPGGSLKSMFYKFMNHQATADTDEVFYIFAFTTPSRESWYDSDKKEWKHSSWISDTTLFENSYKDYVTHTWSPEYEKIQYTAMVSAMLNTARAKGFRYIGFNALKSPYIVKDPNMFWAGTSMEEHMKPEQLCDGGHPNEDGHKWIAGRIKEFIDTAYPGLL